MVRVSIWSKLNVQMMKWFLVFNGPIKFGAGAKTGRCWSLSWN